MKFSSPKRRMGTTGPCKTVIAPAGTGWLIGDLLSPIFSVLYLSAYFVQVHVLYIEIVGFMESVARGLSRSRYESNI